MDAKELRIGNFINESALGIVEIAAISVIKNNDSQLFVTNEHGQYRSFTFSSKGIPLTKEWLLRFGFEKNGAAGFYLNSGEWPTGIVVALNNHSDFYTLNYYATQIHYVHQLQNLYFALTGKELEISA